MAAITNAVSTFTAKGIRENLTDMIYNISPEDTPVLSMSGREQVSNTLHEWQFDSLAATDTANAQLEGDDIASFPATAATTRVGNYTQISRKLLAINGTLEAVDKAGRKSEKAYQMAKRSAELKRDLESIILAAQGGAAGSSGVARTTATLLAWVKTNVDKDAGGVNPAWTAGVPPSARTDGSTRLHTETILQNVVKLGWTSGAHVDKWVHMVGPVNKARISGFSGIATKTYFLDKVSPSAVIGAADVYVSNFGTFTVRANRYQRERDGWFLDPSFLKVAYLRPYFTKELAVTGDNEKTMLLCEWLFKVTNEQALGLAADLQTT